MLTIRQETPSDYQQVEELITLAFNGSPHSDGQEADLVRRLRQDPAYHPKFSLIATDEKEMVGHVLLTEIKVEKSRALALAPLSVHPLYQRKGIGRQLLLEAENVAKKERYDTIIILGDPAYYSRFGYQTASDHGIKPPFEVDNQYFMVKFLEEKAEQVRGLVTYPSVFGI